MEQEKTSYLERLISTRNELVKEREVAVSKRDAIVRVAEKAGREVLSDDEDREFREFVTEIKRIDAELKSKDELIAELNEENQRRQDLRAGAAIAERATASVKVTEEATYAKGAPRSYFKDLVNVSLGRDSDGSSGERLRRHAQDVATDKGYAEYRTGINTTDGTGGYAVPPAWLMDQYITLARAGRPFANAVVNEALPPGTSSLNIPKILTGTAVLSQATQNTSVQETDLTDTSVQATVQTIAGQQILSRQLLDQSPISFDQIVFRDLTAAHAAYLDAQLWTGTGSSGQVVGVNNTSGISTISVSNMGIGYIYGAIANAIQTVHTTRYLPPDAIFMHPRRWGWLTQVLDTTNRPLVVPAAGGRMNVAATLDKVDSQQIVGEIQGVPVITDPNIPTNISGNQDAIYVVRTSDLILFEGGLRAEAFPQTYANQLSVLLQISSYVAFTAARYPASVCEITGLVPTGWGGS